MIGTIRLGVAAALPLMTAARVGIDGTPSSDILDLIQLDESMSLEYMEGDGSIIGGTELNRGDRPYLVHIDNCAGTLISPKVVLSAAHCFTNDNDGSFKDRGEVQIGIFNREDDIPLYEYDICGTEGGGDGCDSNEAYVQRHPNFNDGSFYNFDVAVLILPDEIPSSAVPYSVLNTDDDIPLMGSELEVFGWGETGSGSSDIPNTATLDYLTKTECETMYNRVFTNNQLCAWDPDNNKSACFGDSGGPIVLDLPNGDTLQVGIVSFGANSCETDSIPNVYARVSDLYGWIESTVCGFLPGDPVFCVTGSTTSTSTSSTTTGSTSTSTTGSASTSTSAASTTTTTTSSTSTGPTTTSTSASTSATSTSTTSTTPSTTSSTSSTTTTTAVTTRPSTTTSSTTTSTTTEPSTTSATTTTVSKASKSTSKANKSTSKAKKTTSKAKKVTSKAYKSKAAI